VQPSTEPCPFSRTPRGFEAGIARRSRRHTSRLSAEPLVGLKLPPNLSNTTRSTLSAEPLVGLKHQQYRPTAATIGLSAEPLVGLKLPTPCCGVSSSCLSAEPLVGLKRRCKQRSHPRFDPFSRTPRGFEAQSRVGDLDRDFHSLSAEPLVGLKRSQSR